MDKKKKILTPKEVVAVDETALFEHVASIIEKRRYRAGIYANSEITMMYWEVGTHINSVVLDGNRAEYGKRIVATLSQQLVDKYGNTYELTNLRRMMRFAEQFRDFEIVATLSPQLSWSHIIELLPLKKYEAKLYYAKEVCERNLGVRDLRRQISRKERQKGRFFLSG